MHWNYEGGCSSSLGAEKSAEETTGTDAAAIGSNYGMQTVTTREIATVVQTKTGTQRTRNGRQEGEKTHHVDRLAYREHRETATETVRSRYRDHNRDKEEETEISTDRQTDRKPDFGSEHLKSGREIGLQLNTTDGPRGDAKTL